MKTPYLGVHQTGSSSIRINPAMRRHPKEAAIVGRLLLHFGEIELSICRNAGQAIDRFDAIINALYRLRATSSRIDAADAIMRPEFEKAGLIEDYVASLGDVRHCLTIRNQFAHCNWADDLRHHGLFFADMQKAAKAGESPNSYLQHIDAPLLEVQERYFSDTLDWLDYLNHELALRQGRLSSHFWTKPQVLIQPLRHNPPEEHIPPWLTEDERALHLARALAAKGEIPTPTPGQRELDRQRAKKRARQEAQRQSARAGDLKGNSPPDEPDRE